MSASANQVLVVGGGIGGLSAALALRCRPARGHRVQVLEQALEDRKWRSAKHPKLGPRRVSHVRGAWAHRAEVPAGAAFRRGLRIPPQSITAETIVDMKIDKRFHDKYHARPTVSFTAPTCSTPSSTPARNPTLSNCATSPEGGRHRHLQRERHRGNTHASEPSETYFSGHAPSAATGCIPPCAKRSSATASRSSRAISPIAPGAADLGCGPRRLSPAKMIVWCGGEDPSHLDPLPLLASRTVQPRRGVSFRPLPEEGWDGHREIWKNFLGAF